MKGSIKFFAVIFIGLLLSSTSFSFAASISNIKGKRALINLEGDSVREGEEFFALNAEGKQKALLRVDKIRGDKALATVTKGTAQKGWLLSKRVGTGGAAVVAAKESTGSSIVAGDMKWGIMAGYSTQSAVVTQTEPSEDISHAGTSFYLGGLIDAPIGGRFGFRGLVGYQPFTVTSDDTHPKCDSSGNKCNIAINYLSADLWGKMNLSSGKYAFWVGGAFGLHFAISDASSSIKSNATAQTFMAGAGLDIETAGGWSIPIQLEYSGFTNNETVKANSINLRGGVAFKF